MHQGDFETDVNEAVANLKRVLPLMSKQGVPTTPANYRLWYDYVTRRNDALCKDMEQYLRTGASITPEISRELFERHFGQPQGAAAEELRNALQDLVGNVVVHLGSLGHDISKYEGVLQSSAERLDAELTASELRSVIGQLVTETRRTHERSAQVEKSLTQISTELSELRSEVQRLNKDSLTDPLTGIPNRRAFDRGLTSMTEEATRDGRPLCLAMLDIDHFKKFNDTYGHVVGDRVIRFVARELNNCTKGRDIVARYGGEEFALLLPNTRLNGAFSLVDGIRTLIEVQSAVEDLGEGVSAGVKLSGGIAEYRPGEKLSTFIERADQCLYASKDRGRNRVTTETGLAIH